MLIRFEVNKMKKLMMRECESINFIMLFVIKIFILVFDEKIKIRFREYIEKIE